MERRSLLQALGYSTLAIAAGSGHSMATTDQPGISSSNIASRFINEPEDKNLPGFDSVLGEFRKSAVNYNTKQQENFLSPLTLYVCTSTTDLCNKLSIDQSFSASFGPDRGDEKLSFFQELHTTSTSTTILIYVRHVLHKTVFNESVSLVEGLRPPKSNKQIIEFVSVYGDSFISSVTLGGEYYAAYVFNTQTTEEQSNLVAAMRGEGLYDGVALSGGLQVEMSKFLNSTDTTYSLHQAFSGVKNLALPEPNEMVEFALKFPSLDLDNPAIIDQTTTGYEHVSGFGSFFPVVANRRYFVGALPAGGLTTYLTEIYELQNQVKWIQDIHKFYNYDGDIELRQLASQIVIDIKAINDQIVLYGQDPTKLFTKLNLPSLQKLYPQLDYHIDESPQIGGNGGDLYDFGDPGILIKRKSRISTITTYGQKYLDSITTVYTFQVSGAESKTWSEYMGSPGGHQEGFIRLEPEECINSLSGKTSDGYCGYVSLSTNQGRSVNGGGNPSQMGEGFRQWSLPTGSFVVRFTGRGHSGVDQFKVVYAHLKPTIYA